MKTPAKKRTAAELAAAVLWCALTLGTDRLFFRYDWRTPAFFVYKALFLVLAFGLVHGAGRWCRSCAPGTNLPGGGWPGRCRIWR